MTNETPTIFPGNEQGLCQLVRFFLVIVMSAMAAIAVLTPIAQISGMIFSRYAVVGLLTSIAIAAALLWGEISKMTLRENAVEWKVAAALFLCAMGGGTLSLVCHRPDLDDSDYIPNAVYHLEHPSSPMDFEIHYLETGGKPLIAYYWGGSSSFEYLESAAAYISKIPFLTLYYMLAPFIFGFLIPLAWFYLISRFSFPPHAAVTGVLFICLSLILMGEKHLSYGNQAFNRIFQGKVVFYNIGIPVFTAFTLDFLRSPGARRWSYLFIAAAAAVGFSTSATFMIPLLAIVLLLAYCLCYVTGIKNKLLYGAWYLSALIYPALYAISIMMLAFSGRFDPSSVMNHLGYSPSFLEHAKSLFGPAMFVFWVAGSISAIYFLEKNERRFIALWMLLTLVFYLNPVVSPFLIKHVTTAGVYWRLIFIYPFPLVLGLSGAGFATVLEKRTPAHMRLILSGTVCLFLLAHIPAGSPSIFRSKPNVWVTPIKFPGYKMWTVDEGREALSLKPPPGVMLAMPDVGYALPSMSSQYKQMCSRPESALIFLKDAPYRMRAAQFIDGKTSKENLDSLKWVINRYPQINSIVASLKAVEMNNSLLLGLMKKSGFTEMRSGKTLVVFARPKDYSVD